MSNTTAPEGLVFRRGRWIDNWNPEDEEQWASGGKAIAKRNLKYSIYAEFLGFVVWQLWSIVAVQLQLKAPADAVGTGLPSAASMGPFGFGFSSSQVFYLIAIPPLVGATLRFVYTLMVAKMGGRNWTIISASLLLIPTIGLSLAVGNHPTCTAFVDETYRNAGACAASTGGTPYGLMLLVAALAGLGGGNFASSMANITFFFPQREKGWALGLNAAGGNIGASVAQFVTPVIISLTAFIVTGLGSKKVVNLPIAGWFWIIFIVVAIILAAVKMNNLSSAKTDMAAYGAAFRDPQMWLMSLLYIGTFGSFMGLTGVFPKVINDQFSAYNTPIHIGTASIALAFLGPLVGSLARPYGGKLADKVGGAYVTVAAFLVMALGTFAVWMVLRSAHPSFWVFLVFFLVIFTATGVGNGSMYRSIPTIFAYRAGQKDAQHKAADIDTVRKTSAALGIVSAFGAYGGAIMPWLFNLSQRQTGHFLRVLEWLMVGYVAFLLITVFAYVIPYAKKGTRV